jgi:T5SS/PEP-CTERM-associated repeat protein
MLHRWSVIQRVCLCRLLPRFVLVTMAVLLPTMAVAAVTPVGDVIPSNPSTWTSSTNGYVGSTSTGALTVDSGSGVLANYGYLGYSAGVSGTLTVTGSGSAWTGSNNMVVGWSGNGSLHIEDGGTVNDVTGILGNNSYSTGTVTVAGTYSKWINSNGLTVGNVGGGTLSISGGGAVSNATGYIGVNAGSTGRVVVDGTGSKWTNSADLYLANHTNGSLEITNGGAVSQRSCYIGFLAGSTGSATVDGVGSTWTNTGDFNVGYNTTGTIWLSNSGTLNVSGNSYLAYASTSRAAVTISGSGAAWNNSLEVSVGDSGHATLDILAGGVLNTDSNGNRSSTCPIGLMAGSMGVVTVDGLGSQWNERGVISAGVYQGSNGTLNVTNRGAVSCDRLFVSSNGAGTLNIASGGTVSDTQGYTGSQTGAMGLATVNGTGSAWSNRGELDVGYNSGATGTVTIVGGGAVTASTVSINTLSLMAIDVGRGSSLSTSGTLTNNGKIRVLAGAGVATGSTFAPVSAGAWGGTGTVQAVGGTWGTSNHQFTASAVQTGTSGTPVAMDLASVQRMLVSDGDAWSLGASFLAKSALLSLTATKISDGALTSLNNALPFDQHVLGGWLFQANSGYTAGDPAYLSFDIGGGYALDGLEVWRCTGATWELLAANDLTYDGRYASFPASDLSLSGYAVTGAAVPEPSTLMLAGIGVMGLLGYAWRRRGRTASSPYGRSLSRSQAAATAECVEPNKLTPDRLQAI